MNPEVAAFHVISTSWYSWMCLQVPLSLCLYHVRCRLVVLKCCNSKKTLHVKLRSTGQYPYNIARDN
uniref:Uncharacterized protein n=1 Tax=Arundo donax TaxID=35708 RepID=A0A0A9CLM0_ARUDO